VFLFVGGKKLPLYNWTDVRIWYENMCRRPPLVARNSM
jgi:hypothetical protein